MYHLRGDLLELAVDDAGFSPTFDVCKKIGFTTFTPARIEEKARELRSRNNYWTCQDFVVDLATSIISRNNITSLPKTESMELTEKIGCVTALTVVSCLILSKLSTEIKVLNETVESKGSTINNLEVKVGKLKNQKHQLIDEIESKDNIIKEKANELQIYENQKHQLTNEVESLKAKLIEEGKLIELRKIGEIEEKIGDLTNEIKETCNQRDALSIQLNEASQVKETRSIPPSETKNGASSLAIAAGVMAGGIVGSILPGLGTYYGVMVGGTIGCFVDFW